MKILICTILGIGVLISSAPNAAAQEDYPCQGEYLKVDLESTDWEPTVAIKGCYRQPVTVMMGWDFLQQPTCAPVEQENTFEGISVTYIDWAQRLDGRAPDDAYVYATVCVYQDQKLLKQEERSLYLHSRL
jgi:hypothetical protein